jgi:hypothetical protein
VPSFKTPKRKKDNPVKIELRMNATNVVAMISRGFSAPISEAILFAIMWKNGWGDHE